MLPQFLIGTTVILLTEPMSLGSGVSLFSKKLNPEVQGIIIILPATPTVPKFMIMLSSLPIRDFFADDRNYN